MAGNEPRPLGLVILAILQILVGVFYLFSGGIISTVLVFFGIETVSLLLGIPRPLSEWSPLLMFGTNLISLLVSVSVIIGIIEIIIGLALFTRKRWARILVLIGAIIDLIGFPIGTIFGIILLIYFTRPKVVAYFK